MSIFTKKDVESVYDQLKEKFDAYNASLAASQEALEAAQARVAEAKADMEASGSSITSEDGLKQFTIEGPVHVSKGDMSATGDRLETTPNVTKIKLIGHVHIKQ